MKTNLLLLVSFFSLMGCAALQKVGTDSETLASTVITKYDKFKDVTVTSIGGPRGMPIQGTSLTLRAYYLSPGNSIKKPAIVAFGLTSNTSDWEYINSHNLKLLVDGERMSLGEMSHDGSVGDGYVLEFMWKEIPVEQFIKIVNAKKVACQLFTTEFSLSDKNLRALKALSDSWNVPISTN